MSRYKPAVTRPCVRIRIDNDRSIVIVIVVVVFAPAQAAALVMTIKPTIARMTAATILHRRHGLPSFILPPMN